MTDFTLRPLTVPERKYCLYYGGKRRRRVLCLADVCVCKSEIEEARRRERKRR